MLVLSHLQTEIFAKQTADISHHLSRLSKLYDVMETFLQRSEFIAGQRMTIADLSVVATVSTVNLLLRVRSDKWPRLAAWFDRMQSRPSYRKYNVPGLGNLRAAIERLAVGIELNVE